jgi:membrane fusion protein (multidrug efflux system)
MPGSKFILSLTTIGVTLLMLSCRHQVKPSYSGGAVPVHTYTVGREKVVFYDTYPGTVVALNEVQIHSEVSGYVTGIFFQDGSQIKIGQKLYEIDRTKYQASYDQAKANVDIAEANLDKAQRDADRYEELIKQNAIARQIADNAQTDLDNARMQVIAAKAALSSAATDLNYSVITAPFAGTIGISQVKLGAYITTGQTIMNTLSSNDPIGVDFLIDEKNLSRFLDIKHNTLAESDADSTFRLLLPDNTPYTYTGKLSVIDRAVDPQTGTVKGRIVFPNPERSLREGMNCVVKVLNASSGEQIVLPYKAVVEQMSEYFVYVISNGVANQTKIIPGTSLNGNIIIKEGLKVGEVIALDGLQQLHNGSAVRQLDTDTMTRPGKK